MERSQSGEEGWGMVNLKMNWGRVMNGIGNVLMQGLTPWFSFAPISPVRAMSNVRPDPAGIRLLHPRVTRSLNAFSLVVATLSLFVIFGCSNSNSDGLYKADQSAKDSAGVRCGEDGLFNERLQEIDGPKGVAKVGAIGAMTVDNKGGIYFTDEVYHTIRKIEVDGEVKKIAGQSGVYGCNDGNQTEAHLFNPFGIAADSKGNVYFYDHHMIRKVAADGSVTTLAGVSNNMGFKDGKGKEASFWGYQVYMDIDRDGNLYVGDQRAVRKITPNGVVTTLAGDIASKPTRRMDGRGTSARFEAISSIVVDQKNDIYVLDKGVLRKISKDGEVSTVENLNPCFSDDNKVTQLPTNRCIATSLAIDRSDNLYVGSYGAIHKIYASGKIDAVVHFKIDGNNKKYDDSSITLPIAMTVDNEGNIYCVGGIRDKGLFKVSPTGETSLVLERASDEALKITGRKKN